MSKLFLNWHEDSFFTKQGSILRYDKLEHAILGFAGMVFAKYIFNLSGIQLYAITWIIWNLIGVIWEIYQLVAKKQLIQIKDIAANNIGFILSGFFYF